MTSQLIDKLKQSINQEYLKKFPSGILDNENFIPINLQNGELLVGVSQAQAGINVQNINAIVKEYTGLPAKVFGLTPDQYNALKSVIKSLTAISSVTTDNTTPPIQPQASAVAPKKRLGDQLLEAGLINTPQLMEALALGKKKDMPIGSALVKLGFITVEQLQKALSSQQGVEHIKSSELEVDADIMALLPEDLIITSKAIPLKSDGKELVVGMVNPKDKSVINEIIYVTGLRPKPMIITHIEFETFVNDYFKLQGEEEDQTLDIADDGSDMDTLLENIDQENETGDNKTLWDQVEKELHDNSSVTVKLANKIITDGIDMKASDIHIEPRTNKYIVRYRVDGILKKVFDIPNKIESAILSRFKVVSRMNIAEHRRAQDGTFSLKYNKVSYDFRINTLPVGNKEKMVIRILQPSVSLSDTSKEIKLVGAQQEEINKIYQMTSMPNGVILTSGPTGSGKTTTLYSVLKSLNDESVNITTIEDPIEIKLDGINQTQVNPKANITFANCMRAILRQDPDIILVGEVRDYETLEAAISAALTGHLVLSTIHTNSAAATVTRLIEMGAQDYLIASSLTGVIAQRLVRRLCPDCKEIYKPTKDDAKKIIAHEEDIPKFMNSEIYQSVGCSKCNYDGFVGRLGLYEVMPISKEIKKLIAQSASDVEIEEVAISCGMKTLNQACLEHIMSGETTIDEFIRVLGMVCD